MATDLQLATSDSTDARFAGVAVPWGIFLNGVRVMEGDSFYGYEYVNDSRVSQYPVQSGGFASYNKVDTPFDVRVRITKGGTVADRTALLAEIEAARKSTNLYDIVTPEQTFSSATLSRMSHSHSPDRGATMLTLELQFTEVRVLATARFATSVVITGQKTSAPVTPVSSAAPGPRNDPTQVGVLQPKTLPQVVQEMATAQLNADHAAMSHH